MTDWDSHKHVVLSKADKSYKQSIDEPILNIVTMVNSSSNFFTTSSCSGRIMLINETDRIKRKNGSHFVYVSHDYVDTSNTSTLLSELESLKGNVFFKLEPLIIHIECRSLNLAVALLHYMKSQDEFKHTSIVSASGKKYIVSIRAVVKMEIPVMFEDQIIVSHPLFEKYLDIANRRMKENFEAIRKLESLIQSECLEKLGESSIDNEPMNLFSSSPHLKETCEVPLSEFVNFNSRNALSFKGEEGTIFSISPDGKSVSFTDSETTVGIIPDGGNRPSLVTGFEWIALPERLFALVDSTGALWFLIAQLRDDGGWKFGWKYAPLLGKKVLRTTIDSKSVVIEASERDSIHFYQLDWVESPSIQHDRIKIAKFEKYGSVLIVDEGNENFTEAQWGEYSRNMKVDTVLARPIGDILKTPRVIFSASNDPNLVIHKEDGVVYHIDFSIDSFGPLFVSERRRIEKLVKPGERILEICNGIDCLGIHVLVKVPSTSAVFIQPHAGKAELIRSSLLANGISIDRFSVISGKETFGKMDRAIVSTLNHAQVEALRRMAKDIHVLSRKIPGKQQRSSHKLKHGFVILDYSA